MLYAGVEVFGDTGEAWRWEVSKISDLRLAIGEAREDMLYWSEQWSRLNMEAATAKKMLKRYEIKAADAEVDLNNALYEDEK